MAFPKLREVMDTPIYYTNIILGVEPSHLFYQYGPGLFGENCSFIAKEYGKIKYPIMRYFVDISQMICILFDEYRTCKEKKKRIRHIIERNEEHRDGHNYNDEWLNLSENYANGFISEIVNLQKKNKAMESAILNFAPIVQYGGSLIVRAEHHDLHDINFNKEDFDDIKIAKEKLKSFIEYILKYNIVDILLHPTEFIIDDNNGLVNSFKHYKYSFDPNNFTKEEKVNIPPIHDMEEDQELREKSRKVAREYFLAVYLYRKMDQDLNPNDTINLLSSYNKIFNGERIDHMDEILNLFS